MADYHESDLLKSERAMAKYEAELYDIVAFLDTSPDGCDYNRARELVNHIIGNAFNQGWLRARESVLGDMNTYQARRILFPKLRRRGVTGIVRNGATIRVYECCVCGSQISMDARWAKTKRVMRWEDSHETTCGNVLIERAAKIVTHIDKVLKS